MWKIILIFVNFIPSSLSLVRPNVDIAGRAIGSLIDNMFYEYSMKIKLIVREQEEMFDQITDKVLKYSSAPIEVWRIEKNKTEWLVDKKVQYSYVILSNSLTGSERVWTEIKYKSNVYVRINYSNNEKARQMKNVRGFSDVHYAYYILPADKNQTLYLFGNVLYQRKICTSNFKAVSIFDIKTRQWSVKRFIPENKSFNKCPLKVGIEPISNRYLNHHFDEKGKLVVGGVYRSLLDVFAQKYNIRIDFQLGCDVYNYDMCLSGESTELKGTNYIQTSPIVIDHVTFMITKGEQYTPFEKLLLPFDLETWIYVIVAFIGGYSSVFIIQRFSKAVQNLFFGEKNNEPSLALTRTFFGDGLTQEPVKNFPRILFMTFTIYCLIMRTAYQGKMFDFLHSNTEKWTPQTMFDLIKYQVTVFKNWDNMKLGRGVEDHFEGESLNFNSSSLRKFNTTFAFYEASDFEKVGQLAMITRSNWEQYDWDFYKAQKENIISSKMKIFKDDYMWVGSSWLVTPNSFLCEALERYILELHQHGIIQHFHDLVSSPKVPESESDPQVLSMYILSAGFIVWIVTVAMACIVFIIELFVSRMISCKRRKIIMVREYQG